MTLLGAALAVTMGFVPGQVLATFSICGNGICEREGIPPEDWSTCQVDCNLCGNGICEATGSPPETRQNCQADCGFCGDGICGYPENCSACPSDCGNSCLSFTLSSELKKPGCAGDDDNDCLDNSQETALAWIAAPWYYYDEDENCAGAWYTASPNALHYGRRDFIQVRPRGSVTQWSPSKTYRMVQVTYFLLHPHDCQSHSILGGGHQGDSEHVVFSFKSNDLKKWYLVSSQYYHHSRVHTFSGEYLRSRATEIGTVYPSVAADEDGHGSWPGEKGSSSACAGSEDDFCYFGTCDCFRGTMKGAFAAGYREIVSAARNIGGPPPERWRPSVVSISLTGELAWSVVDVGHGANPEFWAQGTTPWETFCGWECRQRLADGNCAVSVHGKTECTSPLSEKLQSNPNDFTPPTAAIAAPLATADDPRGGLALDLDAAATARLRAGLAAAVDAVVAPEQAVGFRRVLDGAADPVAALVPMLAGRTRADQAETLAWMLAVGREKLASALAPDLLEPDRLMSKESEVAAAQLLGVAVSLLKAEGYTAGYFSQE